MFRHPGISNFERMDLVFMLFFFIILISSTVVSLEAGSASSTMLIEEPASLKITAARACSPPPSPRGPLGCLSDSIELNSTQLGSRRRLPAAPPQLAWHRRRFARPLRRKSSRFRRKVHSPRVPFSLLLERAGRLQQEPPVI